MERIPAIELTPAASGEKIYVRLFPGLFRNLRRLVSWPLLAAYFGLVWVEWDGRPLLLFSWSDGRLYFFGSQWGWGDMPVLAGILIVAAMGLFAASALVGRVWCGMACPQSVWTWLFLRIEEFTEGSAWSRQRADRNGLSHKQWLQRISKHLLWSLLALWTAITFTGYFVPVREILTWLTAGQMDAVVWGWITIMAALTYLNAGLVREKICLHACPYSRFQSVMFDDNTRTVSYDRSRGEAGDCVQCSLCVQVCPTGIDIRDGLQAACIDCGACIDACNSVMDKLGRARGLIGYRSHNLLQGLPSPLLGYRAMAYIGLLLLGVAVLSLYVVQRSDVAVSVHRDRLSLYEVLPDDRVCNTYELVTESFLPGETQVNVSVEGLPQGVLNGASQFTVKEAHADLHSYQLCVPQSQSGRRSSYQTPVTFVVRSGDSVVRRPSTFFFAR